jgi:hypothetical protein
MLQQDCLICAHTLLVKIHYTGQGNMLSMIQMVVRQQAKDQQQAGLHTRANRPHPPGPSDPRPPGGRSGQELQRGKMLP